MESSVNGSSFTVVQAEAADQDQTDLIRKGPWTVEEDLVLVNYIAAHGDGRWNALARSAGLKRSGKSCRLRWLNYLRPDIRRGSFSLEEQLLVLELHSRWGNRWSKIAQHLPGRTDNEIKNYWRTRVQKYAKQLKCDVNSQQFKDAVRYLWMPRLTEKIQAAASSANFAATSAVPHSSVASVTVTPTVDVADAHVIHPTMTAEPEHNVMVGSNAYVTKLSRDYPSTAATTSEYSSGGTWLSSPQAVSDLTDCYHVKASSSSSSDNATGVFPAGPMVSSDGGCSESLLSPSGFLQQAFPDFEQCGWGADVGGGFSSDNLWVADDIWFLEQQL